MRPSLEVFSVVLSPIQNESDVNDLMIYKPHIDWRGESVRDSRLDYSTNPTFIKNTILMNSGRAATNAQDKSKLFHLDIVSNESIEPFDFYLDLLSGQIYIAGARPVTMKCFKKLVASTRNITGPDNVHYPKIHERFVKVYIDSVNSNKPITEINLEMMKEYPSDTGTLEYKLYHLVVKTRDDNTVITHAIKNYSQSDMNKAIREAIMYPEKFITGICFDDVKSNEWINNELPLIRQ